MNNRGFSMIEVIISALIMAILMGGLISAGMVGADQLRISRTDLDVWQASTHQIESLMAMDYDSVVSGTATVDGLGVSWNVTGANPKEVLLVIDRPLLRGGFRPDTFVTYIAEGM